MERKKVPAFVNKIRKVLTMHFPVGQSILLTLASFSKSFPISHVSAVLLSHCQHWTEKWKKQLEKWSVISSKVTQ